MLGTLIKKIFGSRNERLLAQMQNKVELINSLKDDIRNLTDEKLREKTEIFKKKLSDGASLEDILPEAFAVVREAAYRTIGLFHFDVQLIGGMVLHQGKIAEMRTGEGKTLVATLPAYLNALTNQGVHVVTVNDYLAKRDSKWMEPIFTLLGLSVGVIYHDMPHAEKQAAYSKDIVYGTNNEFGFDYLRDNMAFTQDDKVQKELNFAIIDEVDSILIDEARTPLIISGAAEDSSEVYIKINTLIPRLKLQELEESEEAGDYTIDIKQKQANLTEAGHQKVENLLIEARLLTPGESLYHPNNILLMHHVNAALKAHALYSKDVDYIVQNNQVVIVDEHTGRSMPGRRWSDGLHQAVEAKEGVKIQNENQTLASITFQNYFRLYNKLSGMTGTADTEAYEFQQIYGLEVVVIPTNKTMRRIDESDSIYPGQKEKFAAIIEDVRTCIANKQPVLVGTASIEASELLSELMHKAKIKHQVLNAKFHEREAHIIAEAGRPGVVTIATNMAGRGTDIVLGGNLKAELNMLPETATDLEKEAIVSAWQKRHDEVIAAGGLRIIGSERHESRRIDNQLRGRSGRQGDPGSSKFYLSIEDNLMRIFASQRMANMMKAVIKPDEPIENKFINRAIENAQRKLEGYHFDVRKQLLEYDNVANEQRKVIYIERAAIMNALESETLEPAIQSFVAKIVQQYIPEDTLEEQWDIEGLENLLKEDFHVQLSIKDLIEDSDLKSDEIINKVCEVMVNHYNTKREAVGLEKFAHIEKSIMLQSLDHMWREHLAAMDYLRQGIHLRGYAQKDPKQEYKREAFYLFSSMLDRLQYEIVKTIMLIELVDGDEDITHNTRNVVDFLPNKKIGRNDLCPCKSGKKYKMCHGKLL